MDKAEAESIWSIEYKICKEVYPSEDNMIGICCSSFVEIEIHLNTWCVNHYWCSFEVICLAIFGRNCYAFEEKIEVFHPDLNWTSAISKWEVLISTWDEGLKKLSTWRYFHGDLRSRPRLRVYLMLWPLEAITGFVQRLLIRYIWRGSQPGIYC